MPPFLDKVHHRSILGLLIMLMLTLAACSPEAQGAGLPAATLAPTSTVTASAPPAGSTPPPVVTIKVATNPILGSYLTDQSGITLYYYKKDSVRTSKCMNDCVRNWPPLYTSGKPVAGSPEIQGKLGVINRPEGGQQVTYNGLPLYYSNKDTSPGDIFGQNSDSVWFIMPPSGINN